MPQTSMTEHHGEERTGRIERQAGDERKRPAEQDDDAGHRPATDGEIDDAAGNGGWQMLLAPPYLRRLTVVSAGIALHAFNDIAIAPVMPTALEALGRPDYLPFAYGLFFIFVLAGGLTVAALRRRAGPRRALLIAAIVYLVGVACQVLAPNAPSVLAGRVLQGLADGWVVGLCYSLIGELFPPRLVPRVFSAEAVLWAAAAMFGPLAGGLVADLVGWRLALAVSLPFILILLATLSAAPCERPQQASGVHRRRFSLPPRLFGIRSTVGCGSWLLLLMTASQSVSTVYLAYCLHHLFALPATLVGFVLVANALVWSLVAVPVASLADTRLRRRIARCAPLFLITGMMLIAFGLHAGMLPVVILGQMSNGTAFGLIWAIANQAVMDDADDRHRVETSALLPTIGTAGYVIGGAVAGIAASALGLIETVSRVANEAHGNSAVAEAATGTNALVIPSLWLGAAAVAALALLAAQGIRPKALDRG